MPPTKFYNPDLYQYKCSGSGCHKRFTSLCNLGKHCSMRSRESTCYQWWSQELMSAKISSSCKISMKHIILFDGHTIQQQEMGNLPWKKLLSRAMMVMPETLTSLPLLSTLVLTTTALITMDLISQEKTLLFLMIYLIWAYLPMNQKMTILIF